MIGAADNHPRRAVPGGAGAEGRAEIADEAGRDTYARLQVERLDLEDSFLAMRLRVEPADDGTV